MKTSIKILLLILAIALAVGGVMYYLKTIVAPPQKQEFANAFEQHLDSVATVAANKNFNQLEADFEPTRDMIDRFLKEDVVSTESADNATTTFVTAYAKGFNSNALALFKRSYWDHDKVMEISKRVDMLMGYNLSDMQTPAISERGVIDGFNTINTIVTKYLDARRITLRRGYTGINDASSDITMAATYMDDEDLQPNANLMSELANVRLNRANGHVSYLGTLVNNLSYLSRYYDYDEYTNASNRALSELQTYENQGPAVYGTCYSSESANRLRSNIASANQYAYNHFNNQRPAYNGW